MERFAKIIPSCTSKEESYSCEACHDTGMVTIIDEEGVERQARCSCYQRKKAERLLKQSGLADVVDQQTFDTFIDETPTQKVMKEMAKEYLNDLLVARENWNPRAPWFYIGGNPGSGKTHICTAICGELLKRNICVKYMKWLEDSRRLKFSVNDEDFDEQVEDYVNVSVLYIDDLLKQKFNQNPSFTDADIKVAFTILNERYLRNKPTIISSEWDLIRNLLPADEGVFSRVYERCKGHIVNINRNQQNNYRMRGVVS